MLRTKFVVSPTQLILRICLSFMPPVYVQKFKRLYVDFVGPLLALLLLTALVNYGNYKKGGVHQSPTGAILLFSLLNPLLCFLLCKLGKSNLTLGQMISLCGYSLFGHFFTLLVSFLCFDERSNFFFFVCLVCFTGLSTFRLALIILRTLKLPVVRLLICSFASIGNILFIIVVHFVYMHPSFGGNKGRA